MRILNSDSTMRSKRAKSIQKTFSDKILPQEKAFKVFLDKKLIKYEMQKPIGTYNIDFFIPEKKLCIEIDSSYKWGNDRIKAAEEKDRVLKDLGFRVVRINKVWIEDILKLIDLII